MHAADKSLRMKLEDLVGGLPPDQVTLGLVVERIGQEGWLLLCVFLALPFVVPISIPGVSTVFGAAILLISVSLALDRRPWLPARLMQRPFPSAKLKGALVRGMVWLRRLERVSHPRLLFLTQGYLAERLNGLNLVLAALLLMMPFGFVPFSNTLPGLAVLFLAWGALQKDGGCIMLGWVTNLGTLVYFAFLLVTGSAAMLAAVDKMKLFFFR